MISRRVLAAAVLPLSALVAGCGGGAAGVVQPRAAEVGSQVLTQDDLVDLVELYSEDPQTAEVLGGTAPGTWSAPTLTEVVNQWVQEALLLELAEREEIEPTEEQLASARSLLEQRVDLSRLPDEVAERTIEATAVRNELSRRIAEQEGLLEIDEAEVEAIYEAQLPSLEQLCLSQIVILYDEAAATDPSFVATDEQVEAAEARAEEVLDRLEAGEDFTQVAIEESDDQETATAPPECIPASQLSSDPRFGPLLELEEGQAAEPIDFGPGLAVVGLDSRETPPLDEVRASIEQQIQQQATTEADGLLGDAIARLADEEGVWVDGRFGSWDPELGSVVAPQGPVPPSTSTTALDPSQFGIDPSQLEGP